MAPTDDDSGSSSSTAPLSGESNSSDAPPVSIDDSRVIQDVQAFREALQRGETPDRDKLLAKYPAITKELSACLDGLEFVQGAAPQFHNGGPDSVLGTSPDEAFPPHAQLGDYRIVREIGRGGMGVVYEAEQISLARRVALKVLPFAAVMDARQIGRFKNEALAAAQLDHPHIVNVHAVGCERGAHYYAMRFVDGRPLSAVIDAIRQGSTDEANDEKVADTAVMAALSTQASPDSTAFFRQVAEIGRQVADALDHAHRHGVVHRDVKPSNLLLDGEGKAWVADFGLARMGLDANLTVTGDLVGTLRYMSPEQLRGERAVIDHRTDIYSLGLTLYELLVQRPAFESIDRPELLRQIATVDPPPLRRWNRAIPIELETIVLKATAKEAVERYATAQEMAVDLQRYLDDRPVLARRASLGNRTRKWARRHKPAVRTGVAILVFAIAIVAGSVGWIVRDSAAQRMERSREAVQMLNEALRLIELQDWSEAGATARRAETMLAALDGHDEQRLKAKELLAMLHQHDVDRKMAERLEQIRLAEADQPVSRLFGNYDPFRIEFDLNRTAQDYHEAFADYGIEVSTLSPEAASERIRNSDIRDELLVALDDWGAAQHSRYFGEEARKLLQITLLVDPDPWRSRLRTAATQVRVVWGFVNREKGARADVLQFARQSDVATLPPSTLILLSRALCEDYEYSTAQSVLHAGHLRHPDDLWINYELGKLHLRRMTPSQPQAAVAYFRAALASRPESSGVRVWLAEALIALQQLDEAVEILKWAVESNPQCGWGHQLLGQCHERREEWSEAIASYTKWSQLKPFSNPSVRSASIERARCFSKAQQWNEAISEWSKAAEVWPGAVSVRVNLAHAYRNLRRFDEAVEQCQKAIQLEATADNAHFEMGLSLSQKDEWDKALPAFTAAADINPTNFAYRYHVADAYRNLGQFENAVSQYIRAIDLDSTSAEAHADLAWTLSHMRAWNGAIAEYRIAIRLNPDIPRWHNALAWRLVMHRSSDSIDLRDALSSAERAVALNGESANYRNTLGVVLYRCGRWTEAIRALEQSEDLDPSPGQSASNAFFLAMSHAQVGESDTASGWYETGVNVMSEHASELAAHRGHQVELEAIRAEAAESLGLETGPREPIASTNSPIPQALKFSRAAEEKLARAYFDRGERLIDIGKGAEALEYYDAALAIVPESTAFRHARLYALAELSRWTELREGFELLATDRRDDLELLCEYAAALLATGDRDAYQRLCAGVLERDDIWINARRAFLAARICATGRDAATDASRRLELAAKADQLEARRPYTLHVLALAQYRAGLWSDALHSIDASFEAQATWSGHINNWLLLALIHTRLGHPDEARQWADKAADWRQKAYGEVPAGAFPAPGMHVHDRWGCLLLQREVDELLGAGNGDQQRSNTEAIPRSNSTAIPATDTTAPDN